MKAISKDEGETVLATDTAVLENNTVEDPFALDVHVVTDVQPGEVAAPCQTDDGCGHTCASACTSDI